MANVFQFLEVQPADPGKKPAPQRIRQYGNFGFRPIPAAWLAEHDIDDGGPVIAPERTELPFQTSNANASAAGDDMLLGSDLAASAINEGRQAAERILDYPEV